MTDQEIHEAARSLVGGARFIKLDRRWEYSKQGRGSLYRVGGGMLNAMPHLTIKEGQDAEYKLALRIIKEAEKIKLAKQVVV
jgi:hypothetical protein